MPNSRVLHSTLLINQSFVPNPHASTIMASDNIEGFCSQEGFVIGDNINVSINLFSYQQIESFYNILSKDGKISVPLSKQFWGAYFAEFTDKYSINWYLNMMIPPECIYICYFFDDPVLDSDADTTVNLNKPLVLSPYLRFNGQCEEAMKEYQRILGGDLELSVFLFLLLLLFP